MFSKLTRFIVSTSTLMVGALQAAVVPEGNNPSAYPLNLQVPKSTIAHQIFDLHTMMLVVCLVIFFAVFGVMFYSMFAHRKSKGHKPATFHENHTVEIIWTVIPLLIVIAMTIPAAKTVISQKDTRHADYTIKVTGYQWKWGYEYLDTAANGIAFVSTISTPRSEIDDYAHKGTTKSAHYLLDVDKPMVVPVGKKIRLLITANDVIHSWWVPQLGVKQDAIPGFIRESWFQADEPGIYRGVCAELCGKEHGFMPIVVKALAQADYDTWVAAEQKALAASKDDPSKVWTKEDLIARGEKVYANNCVACHQANGQGVPGNFPGLVGSPLIKGPIADHIAIVLNGRNNKMPAWAGQLSDTEIAAVVTYERNAWGNDRGDFAQPAEVKAARK